MKNKGFIFIFLLAVVTILCLPPNGNAIERDFGAGSLIIPMDQTYQPDDDGGILEAYGLVFALLNHQDNSGNHDITVYWIINPDKTTIDGIDFEIKVENSAVLNDFGVDAVAKLYDHAGGVSGITYRDGDNLLKVSYLGAPFIISKEDAVKAKEVISSAGWEAVDVHVAMVPFAANVHREMNGTPPRIALMNNNEKKDGTGNANILESYLRLAGICTDIYDIVTPLEIKDGILIKSGYDFLWAPHWSAYISYKDDVEAVVAQIRVFLESGKGLFAECESIKIFEHSPNGRFLTTNSLGHNGGQKTAKTVVYQDFTSAYSQIGDFPFVGEGGHLLNWRPYICGDPYTLPNNPCKYPVGDPAVTPENPSRYNDTVTVFTADSDGWHNYVGGYCDGDTSKGYAIYLSGHMYAGCAGTLETNPEPNIHRLNFKLKEDITNEIFVLLVVYNSGFSTSVSFTKDNLTARSGDPLEVDVTTATVNLNEIRDITFKNTGFSELTVDSITLIWFYGDPSQALTFVTDTKTDMIYLDDAVGVLSSTQITTNPFTISALGIWNIEGCTDNDDCKWKNVAGVRYVLNTLFNIKFMIKNYEYVRSAPIVQHPYLYQGSFEYPSFLGHFRRYNVTKTNGDNIADWDTSYGLISKANDGNSNGRKVYTARQENNSWSKINFDSANIAQLRASLNITSQNQDDTDEIRVINRLRGLDWINGAWVELNNKLGGIMHSSPVIAEVSSRFSTRAETAYVGDVYGMLHAINTTTGLENWAFIPRNLLGKLKNNRTDPQAVQDFAGVDASPTSKDIYYDHDNNPDTTNVWRTILVTPEGFGGNYIFALDVTDPKNFSVLWEATDTEAPGGGMGHSCRTALNKVKWPIKDGNDNITGYKAKWIVYTATGYASIAENYGGINVYAFDLLTGDKLWNFSSKYIDSVNDIPGAVTLFDIDGDNFMDRVYVGDMNGRMWELNAIDGTNPNGKDGEKEIPLWNCGVGNPISVSPAITMINGNVILIFGTGGTDWAANDQSYAFYAINATVKKQNLTYTDGAATLLWKIDLDVGEKVWSAPTIAAGQIYFATSFGSMESSSPKDDVAKLGEKSGNLYSVDFQTGDKTWTINNIGKTRSSIFVDRQHVYLTTNDNTIIQVGGDDFTEGNTDNVIMMNWREL